MHLLRGVLDSQPGPSAGRCAWTDLLTPQPLGVLGFWVALIVGLSVAAVLYLVRIHKLEHLSVADMKKKIGR